MNQAQKGKVIYFFQFGVREKKTKNKLQNAVAVARVRNTDNVSARQPRLAPIWMSDKHSVGTLVAEISTLSI